MRLSYLSSFFQSGAFLPAPTLFALFSILLLSGCHALFWVMSRVVSQVRRSLRMMCWQQKCWIIWNHLGRLVGKRLNFKKKVARKVAYKNIRKHFGSCIIVQLHYLSIQKVLTRSNKSKPETAEFQFRGCTLRRLHSKTDCATVAWWRLSQLEGSLKCGLEMHPLFLG